MEGNQIQQRPTNKHNYTEQKNASQAKPRQSPHRRVVDAVAGHADDELALPEDLDDEELVLGEHLREPVGVHDRVAVVLPELCIIMCHNNT